MEPSKAVLQDTEDKMKKSLDICHHNLLAIRSGRANPTMVESIRADYYGTPTPLKQMANITIPEPKMLLIQPWDASAVKAIEKALADSDIGIAPIVDGKTLRLVVPPLTKERREELVKIAHKVAEDGKVSIRSVRRDANERLKALEKEKKITEDQFHTFQANVQKLTDKYIKIVDEAQAKKEQELGQS